MSDQIFIFFGTRLLNKANRFKCLVCGCPMFAQVSFNVACRCLLNNLWNGRSNLNRLVAMLTCRVLCVLFISGKSTVQTFYSGCCWTLHPLFNINSCNLLIDILSPCTMAFILTQSHQTTKLPLTTMSAMARTPDWVRSQAWLSEKCFKVVFNVSLTVACWIVIFSKQIARHTAHRFNVTLLMYNRLAKCCNVGLKPHFSQTDHFLLIQRA